MTGGGSETVAVITGAASGIGRATATELARRGLRLMLVDIDERGLDVTRAELLAAGGDVSRVDVVTVDVGDEDACAGLVEHVVTTVGRVDVVVNCAGVLASGPVGTTTLAQWERVMAVNVTGTFLVCRAVLPVMAGAGGGVIVNLASAAALTPRRDLAAYAVSKAAVVMLTKSIALDYADVGIRANCVCPGVIDTPLMAFGDDPVEHAAAVAEAGRSHPLGRIGSPADVAALIGYLVSPECSFMTGSAVVFDGGLSLAPTAP
jgi:NAD(P)-dependent dehydrogenase (short-subunit alcohol dehydrogenase family)